MSTVLDQNFAYSVILSRDAVDLGYPQASYKPPDWSSIDRTQTPYVIGFRDIERSILVTLSKVSVGKLAAKNVEAIVLEQDLARMLPVDLVLGRTFLKKFKLTLNGKSGYLSLS
ncbi:MAG: hypothetical protein JRM80_13100 [Nitrososphaerota archaeon]|nr:hypothetical protein [Nitrososphaerota archaeon]